MQSCSTRPVRRSRWMCFPSAELSGGQATDLPVLTACHPTEKGVLACTTYIVIGLWLSAPGLQDSWAVVSVISSIVTASGGPGGPVRRIIGEGCLELCSGSRKEHSGLLPLLRTEVTEPQLWFSRSRYLAETGRHGGETQTQRPPALPAAPRCLRASSRAVARRQSEALAAALGISSAIPRLLL